MIITHSWLRVCVRSICNSVLSCGYFRFKFWFSFYLSRHQLLVLEKFRASSSCKSLHTLCGQFWPQKVEKLREFEHKDPSPHTHSFLSLMHQINKLLTHSEDDCGGNVVILQIDTCGQNMTHAVWKQTSPLLGPGWPARYRRANLIKLCVNRFSRCLLSEDLTLDSDGITKTVQLTVFLSKPPSQLLSANWNFKCKMRKWVWNLWWHENDQREAKKLQRSYCSQRPQFEAWGLLLLSTRTSDTELGHSYKSVYIWRVLRSWDILFFQAQKERRLGNKLKSKLTCLISLPPPLFLCSAALRERERERELCANLALLPRKIHSWTLLSCLSHYGGESFSLKTWQVASPPNQTTRPRARSMRGEIACICLLRI